jgi:hypothetical protein
VRKLWRAFARALSIDYEPGPANGGVMRPFPKGRSKFQKAVG